MAEKKQNRVTLSKADRIKVSLRATFLQASWNYERMQNVGWAYSLIPAIKRLYQSEEDRAAALKRHLEFFNTHPYLAAPILGVELALEEEKANGTEIDDAAIQGVKIGMMGPLAGVGDPIFWGTLRPVLGAFAASLALSENILGPIIFFVVWNVIRMAFLWYTQELGYQQGSQITDNLGGGFMQKITTGASILGMFIMGVLVPRWTTMNFPLVISRVQNDPDAMVDFDGLVNMVRANELTVDKVREIFSQVQGGFKLGPETVTTLGEVLNSLLPGLMPLVLTYLCLILLRKKVNAITIIFGIFALGILLYVLGIMG